MNEQEIVKSVLNRIKGAGSISLDTAKKLMDKIEDYART